MTAVVQMTAAANDDDIRNISSPTSGGKRVKSLHIKLLLDLSFWLR
jgi:hypothetical protein